MIGNSIFNSSTTSLGYVSGSAAGRTVTASTVAINDATPHHVALVGTLTGLTLYVDGASVASSGTAASLITAPARDRVPRPGRTTTAVTPTTNAAAIDEVRVWNFAMTQAQVQAEAAATAAQAGTEGGLVAVMHMEDATILVGPAG